MKKIPILLLLLVFLGACKNNNPSNRELFEKYYQKNVVACVKGMMFDPNIDSLTATKKCECMMNILYEIDSTIVRKSSKEFDILFEENTAIIDSLCNEL